MGRNWIPKLDWDEGVRHVFRTTGSDEYPHPDSGQQIVYERETKAGREVLCCFWADGFYECVASTFQSGFQKGVAVGRAEALKEIRAALGIFSHPEAPNGK